MKTYVHDYSLPAQANLFVFLAMQQLRNDHKNEAYSLLAQARDSLDQYLAADNMVEDDDAADGWIKARDIDIV